MKGFTRIASVMAASTGILLSSAAAFATPVPASIIAQTTVSTQPPASPGQARFQNGLEAYSFDANNDFDSAASEGRVSTSAPACIASCQPWLTLNQRL